MVEKALKKVEKEQKEKTKKGTKRSSGTDDAQPKAGSEEQKQREELEELVRLGGKLEDVTKAAKEAVKRPSRLSLTKLSGIEESSRINAMKQKLEVIKAHTGGDHSGDDREHLRVLGLQAAMQAAQRGGVLIEKKKSGQTNRDAKAGASADLRKMGKHLLK